MTFSLAVSSVNIDCFTENFRGTRRGTRGRWRRAWWLTNSPTQHPWECQLNSSSVATKKPKKYGRGCAMVKSWIGLCIPWIAGWWDDGGPPCVQLCLSQPLAICKIIVQEHHCWGFHVCFRTSKKFFVLFSLFVFLTLHVSDLLEFVDLVDFMVWMHWLIHK